jgi:hypothetical protein
VAASAFCIGGYMDRVVAIKSDTGEWVLDVLGVPFGGPDNGRDRDGEFFSPNTVLHEDKYPLPPVVYYHSIDDTGKKLSSAPTYIGRTTERTIKPEGVWYRVVLDKAQKLAGRVWEAAQKGMAAASSGTIEHLSRIAKNGEILEWPVGELSLFETDSGKQPSNKYAVALPAMKAVYAAAGIAMPLDIEPEANEEDVLLPEDARKTSDQNADDLRATELMLELSLMELEE